MIPESVQFTYVLTWQNIDVYLPIPSLRDFYIILDFPLVLEYSRINNFQVIMSIY